MRAIRTEYGGILFRSKLEAEWAKFFDSFDIPWIYEPEGFEFKDKTRYLPDFWLPEAHQWFEVKGIMDDIDQHKIEMLGKESKKDVIVGCPNGDMNMFDTGWSEYPEWCDDVTINHCPVCNKHCFISTWGSYECRCCGAYDGDHYLNIVWEAEPYWKRHQEEWRARAKIDVRNKKLFWKVFT